MTELSDYGVETMKVISPTVILIIALISCSSPSETALSSSQQSNRYSIIVKLGLENNRISPEWRNALSSRQSKNYLDSLSRVNRPLTPGEKGWLELIKSRADQFASMRDSLQVPFAGGKINDTIYVLLGYQGHDDAFTYQYQTVCFNLTALQQQYGSAEESINANRIDRLFAHEYSHLLSKDWAQRNQLKLQSFKDSILWECLYEGIGMYRSMSAKWFPQEDTLSEAAFKTFKALYPVFAERIITIDTLKSPSKEVKRKLKKNLSRGSMVEKWCALPVGVWLALEAKGNDKNLTPWVEMGPDAVIPLAAKYLTGDSKINFDQVFKDRYELE